MLRTKRFPVLYMIRCTITTTLRYIVSKRCRNFYGFCNVNGIYLSMFNQDYQCIIKTLNLLSGLSMFNQDYKCLIKINYRYIIHIAKTLLGVWAVVIVIVWQLDTTDTQTCASYLELQLEIVNGGRLKAKLYDKHDDFTFQIVNSPLSVVIFQFHNSYVILELVPSTVMFWIELSCLRKIYSNKTTLLLG